MIRLDLTPGERDALLVLGERWLRGSRRQFHAQDFPAGPALDVADTLSAIRKLEASTREAVR